MLVLSCTVLLITFTYLQLPEVESVSLQPVVLLCMLLFSMQIYHFYGFVSSILYILKYFYIFCSFFLVTLVSILKFFLLFSYLFHYSFHFSKNILFYIFIPCYNGFIQVERPWNLAHNSGQHSIDRKRSL